MSFTFFVLIFSIPFISFKFSQAQKAPYKFSNLSVFIFSKFISSKFVLPSNAPSKVVTSVVSKCDKSTFVTFWHL